MCRCTPTRACRRPQRAGSPPRERAAVRAASATRDLPVCSNARSAITDSGGIQEEAPALASRCSSPATTERGEGVEAGTLALVGTDPGTDLLRRPASAARRPTRLRGGWRTRPIRTATATPPSGSSSARVLLGAPGRSDTVRVRGSTASRSWSTRASRLTSTRLGEPFGPDGRSTRAGRGTWSARDDFPFSGLPDRVGDPVRPRDCPDPV